MEIRYTRYRCDPSLNESLSLLEISEFYFGTTATKSRTIFSSGIENASPSLRANQNALDDPPSRFRARQIWKSSRSATFESTSLNCARVRSLQTPNATLPPRARAANVLRAERVSSSPRILLPRSMRNGPHSTAASSFRFWENSPSRTISIPFEDAQSTPVSNRARVSGEITAPSVISSPIGLKLGSK